MTPTERIDTLLNSRGMSRRQLAIAAGIPPSSLQAAMARGRNLTVEVLLSVAKTLDVSPSYLLGEESELLSPSLQHAFLDVLRERIDGQLIDVDPHGLYSSRGSYDPHEAFSDIYDSREPLTLEKVEGAADVLGVPLEYLISGKNDPADRYPFASDELQEKLDSADARLIDTVHKICGMTPQMNPRTGTTSFTEENWNPAKIDLVREYIKDSQAILKKMIAAMESSLPKNNQQS